MYGCLKNKKDTPIIYRSGMDYRNPMPILHEKENQPIIPQVFLYLLKQQVF